MARLVILMGAMLLSVSIAGCADSNERQVPITNERDEPVTLFGVKNNPGSSHYGADTRCRDVVIDPGKTTTCPVLESLGTAEAGGRTFRVLVVSVTVIWYEGGTDITDHGYQATCDDDVRSVALVYAGIKCDGSLHNKDKMFDN